MRIDVISLFPQMFEALTAYGIPSRALKKGAFELNVWNPRDFTTDNHRTVDDRPYGGGPGMVMMAEPLAKAIDHVKTIQTGLELASPVIYLSPQGQALTQAKVESLAKLPALTLLAGRYEGIDERLIQSRVDEELSIGDYVLAGGEFPAMVLIEAMSRLMPGVLGNVLSAQQDSFGESTVEGEQGAKLLDCQHYTRPEEFEGQGVPKVLLSGHHGMIEQWRHQQSLERTRSRRPDLISDQI